MLLLFVVPSWPSWIFLFWKLHALQIGFNYLNCWYKLFWFTIFWLMSSRKSQKCVLGRFLATTLIFRTTWSIFFTKNDNPKKPIIMVFWEPIKKKKAFVVFTCAGYDFCTHFQSFQNHVLWKFNHLR